jgi:hypothetical protein
MRRLLALALLVLATAGCMGDDGGNGGSREYYVAKADGICGDYQVRLSRVPRPRSGDPAELATYLDRALPIAREQLDKLKDVPKPEGETDQQDIERLFSLLEQELDLNEAAQKAAAAGDTAAVQSNLQQAAPISAQSNQLAEQLGFVVCARRA